jgi:hypothetical protein
MINGQLQSWHDQSALASREPYAEYRWANVLGAWCHRGLLHRDNRMPALVLRTLTDDGFHSYGAAHGRLIARLCFTRH